ncbi:hypothetical protein [Brevibacillus sp. HB1.1]|uniref:hypothetical protein n=1 Tax=Brevibacillus sp. HB1.1 TaxID=2738808 RepID=UPI0020C6F3B5|nr:hypothetical protein [Brevibacillus sp. HB1.1]
MSTLSDRSCQKAITPLPPADPDALAGMLVVIYDSVSRDFAIVVSWFHKRIRREW